MQNEERKDFWVSPLGFFIEGRMGNSMKGMWGENEEWGLKV